MFIAVAAMMACGLLVAVSSGYLWPFIWILIVVAAKDISYRKDITNIFVNEYYYCRAGILCITSWSY